MSIGQLLLKPMAGKPCNGCGYCCSTGPCELAEEFLQCTSGPCVALESRDGQMRCGLVRNPLGYLFKAAHPNLNVPVLEEAPNTEEGHKLSSQIAAALGMGYGCDSEDDQEAVAWNSARILAQFPFTDSLN